MSQVFCFKKLPLNVQREIAERLEKNDYKDFASLAEELRGRGYRISKSSLHRFSQQQLRSDADFLAAWAARNPMLAAALVAEIKASTGGRTKPTIPESNV